MYTAHFEISNWPIICWACAVWNNHFEMAYIILWILYAFVVGHSMVSTITIRFDNNVIFEKKICIVDVVWLEHFDRYVYISKSWTSLSLWDMFYMCRMCFFTEKYLNLEHFDIFTMVTYFLHWTLLKFFSSFPDEQSQQKVRQLDRITAQWLIHQMKLRARYCRNFELIIFLWEF